MDNFQEVNNTFKILFKVVVMKHIGETNISYELKSSQAISCASVELKTNVSEISLVSIIGGGHH
jgi:hypothetical protein